MSEVADPERHTRRELMRLSVLPPGLYAWASTVALPVAAPHVVWSARALAAFALVALLASPLLGLRSRTWSLVVGVHAFVGASLGAWTLLRVSGAAVAPHPAQAAFGAIAWMLYAFGWGELRSRQRVPEQDPHVLVGPPLLPRKPWNSSAEWVLGVGVLGACGLLWLAWRVTRPSHAVLAHSVALLASLLSVSAATRVSLERSPRSFPTLSERYNAASTALAALIIALGLGAMYWMLEH